MKFKIKYRRATFTVEGEKSDTCQSCHKKPHKSGLHFHHRKYAYSTKEVRKNPQLALENTIQLCWYCHRVADALRVVESNPSIVINLGGTL
jgi:hypothetical protein